jgi:DNA-binding NtrC family response regulator
MELFHEHTVHAVISDYAMPKSGDGLKLALMLSGAGFDMSKFVLISGTKSAEDAYGDLDAMGASYLKKSDLEGMKSWVTEHVESRPKPKVSGALAIIDDDKVVRASFINFAASQFPDVVCIEAGTVAELEQHLDSIHAVISDYQLDGGETVLDVANLIDPVRLLCVSGLMRKDLGDIAFIGKGNLSEISAWIEAQFF